MMRKRILLAALLCTAICGMGCGAQIKPSEQAERQEETSAQENTASVSVGYVVLANGQEAADLYAETDGAQVLSKMFHGEPISVFSIDGEWAKISYGGTQGYVKLENVSFSKPEMVSAEQPTEDVKPDDTVPEEHAASETSGAENASVNNRISNEINIVFLSDGDGFQIADPVLSYEAYVPETTERNAWCSAQSVYIYAQPSKNSAKREANMLYYGDSVTVLGAVDGWYYISTDSGNGYDLHGYVGQSYITYGESPAAPENPDASYGRVSAGSANVRSSPNKETNDNILFTLYEGDTFEVLSYDGYWYQIVYNDTICYISHKMVEVW